MSIKKFKNEDSLPSSDSEDLEEIFCSSSSHDRSSVNSIPWAEDAIKQNQQEWERIERMFHGEEELPDDPDLRREIIEWNKAFPHLRVVGKKIEVFDTFDGYLYPKTPEIKEEIIVMHPIQNNHSGYKRANSINKLRTSFKKSNDTDCDTLLGFLERDLRISSVPMLSKRKQTVNVETLPLINKPKIQKIVQPSSSRQIVPSKSSGSLLSSKNITKFSMAKTSTSASFIRMPPIIILPSSSTLKKANRGYINNKSPKKAIVLPAINLNNAELTTESTIRSISAATKQNQPSALFYPISASKLEFSK